jgi:hypothetical protein
VSLLLVFPPFSDASQPSAALPSLAAALDGCGMPVELWDANLDAWEWLLQPARQAGWLAKIEARLERLDRRRTLKDPERLAYRVLADAWLRGRASQGSVAQALRDLRSPAFFSAPRYRRAVQAIDGALAVVSAASHPSRLEWGRFWPASRVDSSRALVKAAQRAEGNPFADFARSQFGPRLRALSPKLVGISITFLDQVLPALTLAAECRRVLPKAQVILGGQIVSLWGDDLLRARDLWRLVDVCVRGDGESALRGLVQAHLGGGALEAVPNLVLPPSCPVRTTEPRLEELANLPCPDYRGLPLERYLAPEPVLTLSASRGCYWSRCTFCAVSPGFRGASRARSAARVRADMAELRRRHRARLFTFGDDALPRAVAADLAQGPETAGFWQAELRWEAADGPERVAGLGRAGARNLIFGLESGSEEVLRRMAKGASLRRARSVLDACDQSRIGVNLQCFLGFPGETRAQALETFRFLERSATPRTTVSCGLFELQKGSPLWRTPEAFGIEVVPPAPGRDLSARFEYRPHAKALGREQLQQRIERRFACGAPQLRCGINAHALIYLALAPSPAAVSPAWTEPAPTVTPALLPGTAVRRFSWDPDSLHRGQRPVRRPVTLAFSLERGRVMALGELAAALLRHSDGRTPVPDLLTGLDAPARRKVLRAFQLLAARGLLPPIAPLVPARTRPARVASQT